MNQLVIQVSDIPLHAAVKRNDLEEVNSLLKHGADLAEQNKYEQNVFHLAALIGNKEIIELLLNTNPPAGVVEAKDENGNTPFHFACREADEQSAELLLGENINLQNSLGYTALHLALKDNRLNIVNFLLSKGADVNVLDKDKNPPLHLAINAGSLEAITALLEVKDIKVNLRNAKDDTTLSLACNLCSLDLLKILVNKGALSGISRCASPGYGIDRPLCVAASKEWKEGVTFLFNQGQFEYQDHVLCSSLKSSINRDYVMLAKLFFAKDDRFYLKALEYAASCNNLNAIKYILDKHPELIDQNLDEFIGTPLFMAVRESNYQTVKLLLVYVWRLDFIERLARFYPQRLDQID